VGGACGGVVGLAKSFIEVQAGEIQKTAAAGVACARVSEMNKGNYGNALCQGAPGGQNTGEYIKVKIKEIIFGLFWWVESTEAKVLPAEAQVTKLTSAKATLKTKILGAEVKFTTSTAPELVGVKLNGEGKLANGAQVKFKGLTTEINGKVSAACKPPETVTSNKLKGGLLSHEEGVYVQLTPETGTTLATLQLGELCSLGEKVPLITNKEGKTVTLTDPLGIGKELKEHEVIEFPSLTELWAISATAEHKATLEGGAAVGLTGAHAGFKWNGKTGDFELE
jgi:hypothetical protein